MIETCGKELQKPRKLKDFCSYSHRGKHVVKALDGAEYQSGLSGSKNTKRNKALRTLQKHSRGDFTFHRINSVTYRIDGPRKRAVGWLMEVAWHRGSLLRPLRQKNRKRFCWSAGVCFLRQSAARRKTGLNELGVD